MADDGESLESWLNKATSPSNRQEDWEYIMGFCDQINKELEGPQISVRLLAHKIQSPQEWEAIQALTVLEACMKNCGRRFHNEVGKFRFLNELIKVVSPKYLGDKVSEGVKIKVIEMLYSWTMSLPDEAKICEAYQMLKSQGIVSEDPEIPLDATLIPSPSPRPKNPVFDDEKKSKRLSELLKSKKPEDLQEANRLIKNMVKEDEVRTQRSTKQQITLEAVNNSVKVLNEMIAHFSPEDSTDADKELIKELYGDCDKLRQTVFQLATETEDNDSCLETSTSSKSSQKQTAPSTGDILQASDDLSHVMNSYKKIVERQTVNGETEGTQRTQSSVTPGGGRTNQSEILIDLVGLDNQSDSPPELLRPPVSSLSIPADLLCGSADPHASCPGAPSAALSLLDEELLSLGLNEAAPVPSKTTNINLNNNLASLQDLGHDLDLFDTTSSLVPAFSPSSLFPDALSAAACSAVSSDLSHPVDIFSTPPVSSASFSTTLGHIFPQPPPAAVSITALPAPLPQAAATVSPASSADPAASRRLSDSAGGSHSLANSLSHNLQDLALLDLGSPKNLFCDHLHGTPDALDVGSLLVESKEPHAPADLSSNPGVPSSTTSSSLLLGGMHDGSGGLRPFSHQADDSPLLRSLSPVLPLSLPSPSREQDASLANVCVPLDAIKPSQVCPVTAYDKNGVRVLLHFTTNTPPERPDVLVMVASMLNTAPLPVRNVVLQAAVPKTMKVKLQPPSGTELVPFNPILPPAAITQVILLANPLKEKVRMRYKLTFTLGEQPHTEVGEVNEFPPADTWGTL